MFTLILKHLFVLSEASLATMIKSCLFPDSFSCGKFSTDQITGSECKT